MQALPDIEEAKRFAGVMIGALQDQQPPAHPMQAMAAAALALGSMVASASELGITKEGQSGKLLAHLFKIAESGAEEWLGF